MISFERRDFLSPSVIVFIFIPRRSHPRLSRRGIIKGKVSRCPLHILRERLLSSRDRQSEWRRARTFFPSLPFHSSEKLARYVASNQPDQRSQGFARKLSSLRGSATFVGLFTVGRLISLNKRTRTVHFQGSASFAVSRGFRFC